MLPDAPAARFVETPAGLVPERRKRKRVAVHWILQVWRSQQERFDARTVNISTDGFYCLSPHPFTPGETLIALLEIPIAIAAQQSQTLTLRCEAAVLRVEALVDGRNCGVAARIINYSVLRGAVENSSESDGTKL